METLLTAAEESWIQAFIEAGIAEDAGSGDHTSLACIPPESRHTARLLVKDHGVLAGVAVARRILHYLDPEGVFTPGISDGEPVKAGDIAFEVSAHTRALLLGERLLLNTMQRMSGIATETARYCDVVKDLPVRILDTRKTTPGLRFLEKWAVRAGGGVNYRSGLYDWFMIKDNHIDAAGGIREAIERVLSYRQANALPLGITVEVRNFDELEAALSVGQFTRIMFDNFSPEQLRKGVETVGRRFETEASGGIHLDTLRTYALTGVDFISIGALTHSVRSLDLSFKLK
jgi:nicotinate-nucleotide pyrophosphorylase (carboxylating)